MSRTRPPVSIIRFIPYFPPKMESVQLSPWYPDENMQLPAGVPDCHELLLRLDLNEARGYLSLPACNPVCFVKYGLSVDWNEPLAQHMAQSGLASMGESGVRAPIVYYAFRYRNTTVIAMEYIRGHTVLDIRKNADAAILKRTSDMVANAITTLARIPVPAGCRPSAIDNGRPRHILFDQLTQIAPRHYENARQLEEHINYVSMRIYYLCASLFIYHGFEN